MSRRSYGPTVGSEMPFRIVRIVRRTPCIRFCELARDADLLVAEANSVEDRRQRMINSGAWQVMTPIEGARILRQATEGHLNLVDIGMMATRANVKTVVLTHLTARAGTGDYSSWAAEVSKHFSGQVVVAKDLGEF